jgi:hypothetical protein
VSQRRFGSYLRYAVGEILLVVIGILIALQINNWNEERIERRQAREFALALADDLAADLAMVAPVDDQIRVLIRQITELAGYTRGKSLDQLENAELFNYTRSINYRPYAWSRATLEQIKISGALRQMSNRALVEKISAYDALSQHLDLDYTNDRDKTSATNLVVTQVVNRNYANWEQARDYSYQIPDGDGFEPAYFGFRNTDIFAKMKADTLPVIARDVADLERMVSVLLDIRNEMWPRVRTELPQLRGMAAEIIQMIETDYGDG